MKNIKSFTQFNENSTNAVDVYSLSHEQIYYLIEFLESTLEMFDHADFEHFQNETGLDITTLMDLYLGYGYDTHSNRHETQNIKAQYCKLNNVTWESIVSKHDREF